MQYRKDKYGNDLSILGFGCLRFPQKGGSRNMVVCMAARAVPKTALFKPRSTIRVGVTG